MTIDQEAFERLIPIAYRWAKNLEDLVLTRGAALSPRHVADARLAGVQDVARVRVLVVDRLPLPDNPALAEAARVTGIITHDTRCIGFGHAVIVRADAWGDRELFLHNLVHVAQSERAGGLEQWIKDYLTDRHTCAKFTVGTLEEEARGLARDICHSNVATAAK